VTTCNLIVDPLLLVSWQIGSVRIDVNQGRQLYNYTTIIDKNTTGENQTLTKGRQPNINIAETIRYYNWPKEKQLDINQGR